MAGNKIKTINRVRTTSKRLSIGSLKVARKVSNTTIQDREGSMPIDLLRSNTRSLMLALALQALDIVRMPFKARYLDIQTIAISQAPVRADTGGWSDCWWFLEKYPGFVCNLALSLYSYVVAVVLKGKGDVPIYHALDIGDSGALSDLERGFIHEAADNFPKAFDGRETHIIVNSFAPPKAGLGSSGSVGVAIVALLNLLSGGQMSREEIALMAHKIEHFKLGRESGIQDQVAAAFGSSCIEMLEGQFPKFLRSSVDMPPGMVAMIEKLMILVNTGEGRSSSEEHERKIATIRSGGPGADAMLQEIIAMREAARRAAECLRRGDWPGFCEAVGDNWKHQVALDSSAVTDRIERITDLARRHSAMVKVWGAAGGGVMGILCPDGLTQRSSIVRALNGNYLPEMPGAEVITTSLAPRGVEVCTFTQEEIKQLLAAA